MNPKPHRRFLPLILTWLIILGIQTCLCQNEYQTCNQRFQCGRLERIGYPFYGGNRPLSCGYPGFELINCQGTGDPLLNISSMMYRVLNINPSAGTLRVARNDLLENTCPSSPSNTTLDFTHFDYDSSANDQNITLYYSCTIPPTFLAQNYQLDCNGNGLNFFATREVSEQLNSLRNPCSSHIYVPVNQSSAGNLGNVATASMDALRSGLESGFTIQYLADNQNCNNCVDRGGLCGYNQSSTSLACYTSPNGNGNGMHR